jgi:nucleoside-diphosphate-sugar epimerase
MTSPAAAGQRFLGSGSFIWYRDIARLLRERLPGASGKVRTRAMPDLAVKLLARRSPQMAMLSHELGRKRLVDGGKARTLLGWQPRPTEQTIIDTATALMAKNPPSR